MNIILLMQKRDKKQMLLLQVFLLISFVYFEYLLYLILFILTFIIYLLQLFFLLSIDSYNIINILYYFKTIRYLNTTIILLLIFFKCTFLQLSMLLDYEIIWITCHLIPSNLNTLTLYFSIILYLLSLYNFQCYSWVFLLISLLHYFLY